MQQAGTVDHTPVYPREVVKRALELSATAIILVHNYSSGDPTPSQKPSPQIPRGDASNIPPRASEQRVNVMTRDVSATQGTNSGGG